jgi:hypothetical protein
MMDMTKELGYWLRYSRENHSLLKTLSLLIVNVDHSLNSSRILASPHPKIRWLKAQTHEHGNVSGFGYIGPVPGLSNLQPQALSYRGVGVNTISSKAVLRHCES